MMMMEANRWGGLLSLAWWVVFLYLLAAEKRRKMANASVKPSTIHMCTLASGTCTVLRGWTCELSY